MSFGSIVFTNRGKVLQSKAQAGIKLNFTKLAIGDGELGSQSVLELTDLKSKKLDIPISSLKVLTGGIASVGGTFTNQGIQLGFYWRELGLYATDPDLGEILYCYGNAGALAEYIPSSGGSQILEKFVAIETIVGNASNVSATINGSLVYATLEDIEAHNSDPVAHPVLVQQIKILEGQVNNIEIPSSLPANGGNADTVGGYVPSTTYKPDGVWIPVLAHNIPLEIGEWIDFHKTGSAKDYDGRLYIDATSGNLKYQNALGSASGDIYTTGNKPTKADVGLGNVPNYPISTDPRESNHSKFASIGAVAQAMGMAEQAMRYVNELKPKVGSTAWKTNTSVTTVCGEDIGNQYTVLGHIVFRSEDEILIEMDSFQLVFDQTRYKADMAYATRTIGFVPSKTVGQPPAGSIIQVGTSSGADYLMKVYHNDNFDVKKALGVSNIELGRHTVTLPKVSFKATGMSLYSDFNAGNYVIVGRLEFASNYVANRDATMVHVSGWGANRIRVGWS